MSAQDPYDVVVASLIERHGEPRIFGGIDGVLRAFVNVIRAQDAATVVQGEALVRGVGRAMVKQFEQRVDAAANELVTELVERSKSREA